MAFFVDFAVFFRTIDGRVWYGTEGYGMMRLKIRDNYGLPMWPRRTLNQVKKIFSQK